MKSQDQTGAAETKEVENALESIAQGQRDVGLYFHTATGELRTSRDDCRADADRLPATRMAREGFFAGGRLPAMSRLERLDVEKATLSKMPGIRFQFQSWNDERCGVVCEVRTNAGNCYTLWIRVGRAFPNKPPKMYVLDPKPLRDYRGKELSSIGESGSMHLRQADRHGHPQICHYHDSSWTPNVTLYKVVGKGRLWLEAYDLHRKTGKGIDHYLRHMGRSGG